MICVPASGEQWKNAVTDAILPILPVSRTRASALRGRPGLNSNRLHEIAKGDAALGLQLLSRANKRARTSKSAALRDGVETLSHGVSLLGVDNALECAISLPTLDSLDEPIRRQGYIHTLGKAHLASELSELWFGKHEGARCAAQGHFAGELYAWVLTENPAELFSTLFEMESAERASQEGECFGISLEELSNLAARAWELPPPPASEQEVAFTSRRRAQIAKGAAHVAQAVNRAWKGKDTQAAVGEIATFLGAETETIWSTVYRATAAAARSFAQPYQMHMARTLLFDSPKPVPPAWYQVNKPRDTKPTAGRAKPNVIQLCGSVLKHFATGQLELHEMLKRITENLGSGYGLEPVVMSMLTRDRGRLVARFSSSRDVSLMGSFDIDLAEPSLFNRLLNAQQGLFVDKKNCQKVWSQMPSRCRAIMPEFGFCLLPFFVQDKPIGLFYAGGFPDREDEAKTCYKQFKKICLATAHALEPRAA